MGLRGRARLVGRRIRKPAPLLDTRGARPHQHCVLDATEGNQYFAIRSFGMLERTGDDKGRFEIKRSLREVEPGAKGGPGLAWPSGLPYRTAHLPDFRRRRLVA